MRKIFKYATILLGSVVLIYIGNLFYKAIILNPNKGYCNWIFMEVEFPPGVGKTHTVKTTLRNST